jgi:hypothetical protein
VSPIIADLQVNFTVEMDTRGITVRHFSPDGNGGAAWRMEGLNSRAPNGSPRGKGPGDID